MMEIEDTNLPLTTEEDYHQPVSEDCDPRPGYYSLFGGPTPQYVFYSPADCTSRCDAQEISSVKLQGMCGVVRSKLLEDFCNNCCPDIQLADLEDHLVEFSLDQAGSQFIQQKLESAPPSEKQTTVFSAAKSIQGQVLTLVLNRYGCRVFQCVLECISSEMRKTLIRELEADVLQCVKDEHGSHIIQKCIVLQNANHSDLKFVVDAIKGQVYSVATHPYGFRVILCLLENCSKKKHFEPVMMELHSSTDMLVLDEYGSKVVQHILQEGRKKDKTRVISELQGEIGSLSKCKFASTVIEKCIECASRHERSLIFDEICTLQGDGLREMKLSPFGNSVVQKMMEMSTPRQRRVLLCKVHPHASTLQKIT